MISWSMYGASLLGAWLAVLGPVATAELPATVTPVSRAETSDRKEAFLQRAEAAFATRDPGAVAALADVETWRAEGYPELSTLQIFLPPAPLIFEKVLAPSQVIYRDGNGRKWRLVLTEAKGEYRALVRAEPCPRGAARAPQYAREERPTPKVQTWTLLECWPLPK